MFEVFFDQPYMFSFFKELWNSKKDEINVTRILYNFGISPKLGASMLQDFVFLGILSETDDSHKTGVFKLNRDSPIVLFMLLFDDVIEKYVKHKILGDGEDEAPFIEEISIEDFLKILEDGLK